MAEKSLHSICRWTFNPGKGGFVPGDQRPEWGDQRWCIPHWSRQSSLFPCSASLLKFTAWILLIVPACIFILSKMG